MISDNDYQAMKQMLTRIEELIAENTELREKLAAYEGTNYAELVELVASQRETIAAPVREVVGIPQ